MPSSSDDLTGSYAVMSETEFLELARSFDSLTESTQAALRAEFARRDLEPPIVDESETEPVSRRLVTLRRYRDLSEAIVVRSLLESAGVSVYLADENLVRLDWQISNFIGGIRLQVDANDEATATALLEEPIPDSFHTAGAPISLNPTVRSVGPSTLPSKETLAGRLWPLCTWWDFRFRKVRRRGDVKAVGPGGRIRGDPG